MKSSKVHIFHRMMETFHHQNIAITVWTVVSWGVEGMLAVKTAFPELIVFKLLTCQDPDTPATPALSRPCSCLKSQHRVVGSISAIKNTLEQRKVGWKKKQLSRLPGTHCLKQLFGLCGIIKQETR